MKRRPKAGDAAHAQLATLPAVLKLFVGQHIVNGLSVAVSVMAATALASAALGFAAGQPATLGAVSASLSDFPAPWRAKARMLLVGFGLALVSTSTVLFVGDWPPPQIAAIGLVAFGAGMVTGFGRWAQALIPMVFVMGLPRVDLAHTIDEALLLAAGGLAYIVLALAATRLTGA